MLKDLTNGFAAGLMVSVGGMVFLSCESRYVGAVMFAVALLCICYKGYALFTGKVGYIVLSHKKADWSSLLVALLGNFIATVFCGYAIAYAIPELKETALTMCTAKLGQVWTGTLIRGFFCGILMYLAVNIYREKNTALGILFCVPVFILSGFEHSIADMFYIAASGIVSFDAFVFIWVVILGNTLGGMFMPALRMLGGDKNG